MRYVVALTAFMGLAVLTVGCADGTTGPASETQAGDEPTAFEEGVVDDALSVVRYEAGDCPGPDTRGPGFLCESKDEVARYFVSHYQADDIFFCGGSSFFARWAVQEKATGAGTHFHSTLTDTPIFIYDWDALIAAAIGGNLCGHVINGWVYQGTHDMVLNEVVRPDGSFTARWSGQGFVYDQAGNRFRYSEHQTETEEGFTRQVVSVK